MKLGILLACTALVAGCTSGQPPATEPLPEPRGPAPFLETASELQLATASATPAAPPPRPPLTRIDIDWQGQFYPEVNWMHSNGAGMGGSDMTHIATPKTRSVSGSVVFRWVPLSPTDREFRITIQPMECDDAGCEISPASAEQIGPSPLQLDFEFSSPKDFLRISVNSAKLENVQITAFQPFTAEGFVLLQSA